MDWKYRERLSWANHKASNSVRFRCLHEQNAASKKVRANDNIHALDELHARFFASTYCPRSRGSNKSFLHPVISLAKLLINVSFRDKIPTVISPNSKRYRFHAINCLTWNLILNSKKILQKLLLGRIYE